PPHPFSLQLPTPPRPPLFPYTTLFRSGPGSARRARQPAVSHIPRRSFLEACAATAAIPLFKGFVPMTQNKPHVAHASRNERLGRSEEHTSELQSPYDIVCRLLLEKKKT